MSRKSARKKRKQRLSLKKILSLIGLTIFLVAAVIIYIVNKPLQCANSISCIKNLSGTYEPAQSAVYMGKVVTIPSYISEANQDEERQVLGEQTGKDKHIYVDLSHQQLFAYEGTQLVYSFPISSGKWYPTPTGDFRIWIKLRYTRMSGGNAALGTYYNLPNVPFTMFFANDKISRARGFSLHGTYWHNNFGHPMSHGCVNISIENAQKLYYWADPPTAGNTTYATADNPGTLVTIYGVAPAE